MCLLNTQVGTHTISPLWWSIDTGSLEADTAILIDLLSIRSDCDQYYYDVEPLFERRGDIIHRIIDSAPRLLPILLSGLIWRSRLIVNGTRRANHYIRHLGLITKGHSIKCD